MSSPIVDDKAWRHCEHLGRLMSHALSRLDANDLDGFQRLAERVAEEAKPKEVTHGPE